MKKMKSLALAFAAVAGMGALGAAPAEAQTVPVNGGGQVYTQQAAANAPVSQQAIDDLAYNVGVQTVYYRDGRGFTQGWAQDGEYIGLEFQLNGNNATVTRAYNLNDPYSARQFQQSIDNAARNDDLLAQEAWRYPNRVYTVYEPTSYVICAPVVPIIGIGWVIGGWHVGYVPVYHTWGGFWEGGHRVGYGHGGYGHGGYNNHTTIINNNTTVINRGGNNGQWGHDGHRDGGQWQGGHDVRHDGGQWQNGGRRDGGQWNDHHQVAAPPPVHRVDPAPVQQHIPQQQPNVRQGGAVERGGFQQHAGGMQHGEGGMRGPGGHHR